jgi:hypothetical protein
MIKVIYEGGLGNQMFQFAFGYASSKKLNTKFKMIGLKARNRVYKYFEIKSKHDFWLTYFYILGRKLFPKKRNNLLKQKCFNDILHHNQNLKNVTDQAIYQGTFVSINYFLTVQDDIKSYFRIKPSYIIDINKLVGINPGKKKLVMHFRRTDYLYFGTSFFGAKDLSLPISYYINCLNLIDNINDYQIVAVGDDLDFVKQNSMGLDIFTISNSEITDFQIIQQADIIIISNSTFSWWAAYLSHSANKVYAPKYWLGFHLKKEMPGCIYDNLPDTWEIVDFN